MGLVIYAAVCLAIATGIAIWVLTRPDIKEDDE